MTELRSLVCPKRGCGYRVQVRSAADLPTLAAASERRRCEAIVREYLVYDSQRAVSWHEIQDTLEVIRKAPPITAPLCERCNGPLQVKVEMVPETIG